MIGEAKEEKSEDRRTYSIISWKSTFSKGRKPRHKVKEDTIVSL